MHWSQRLTIGTVGVTALVACDSKARTAPGDSATAEPVAQRAFSGDAAVAAQGRVLFIRNNCYGCHGGLAGGGMGPSLRDTTWLYGGTASAIYSTIHDGRPTRGMPTWGTTLTPDEIRKLVVYIQSLRSTAEPKEFFVAAATDTTKDTTR
jgi:cytochrome c oxidase cbb3-type subunit 3